MPFTHPNEFDPGLPPAEYALPEALGAEFMDIPKAFGAGFGEGTHLIGEGVQENSKKIAHNFASHPLDIGLGGIATSVGMDALGNMLNSAGHSIGDFFKGHMSEGGQKVMDTPLYQDGHFTDTAKNPLNWPIVAADAVGQTAPVIAASATGGLPLATAAGFSQNAGGTSEAAHSVIMSADDNQLMQSSTFVNLFKNIDQDPQYSGYSDLQKIDLAKKQLADTVAMADISDPKMLAANLLAAYTGDAYLGQLFAGRMLSSSVAKTLVKAGVRDAGINAGYAGTSQYVENEGMNKAGIKTESGQGVKDQMITGGLTGLAMGGVPAIIGHVREGRAAGRGEKISDEPADLSSEEKTEKAVDDIETGAKEVQQGRQDLKEEIQPEEDMFSKGLGGHDNTSPEPRADYRNGLTPEQAVEQERLASGFNDREKFGGNAPDDFADIPAYMRAGKTVHTYPDSRPFHLVDAAGPQGQVKARFDDKNDAEIFRNAQLLDQYSRGKRNEPDENEHQAVKDWFYRMTRGVKREDADAKKRKRSKKGASETQPQREPRNDFEAKNIHDTIMGYYQFVRDTARNAENGEYTAPSMADYAEHRFPDRPLALEDKNIIFAGGPVHHAREDAGDETQSGAGPEFRAGERVRGQEFIPAERAGGGMRQVNTIDGEARRVLPELEDKNIIFAGGPVPDEGQRGAAPQFEGGRTKARRRLDRFEDRMGSRQKHAALPYRQLSSGEAAIPDSLSEAAKTGNGELYMRRNGKPFPSDGLARLSKPYSEAKKAGEQPEVVKVDGGYAVEVPDKKDKPVKKGEPAREPDKPDRRITEPETRTSSATDISITSPEQHSTFFRHLIENPEGTSPDDVRSALESTIANKDAITHALGKLTKEQLKPYSGRYVPSDVKKGRLVDNAWDSLVNDFRWLVNKGPTMVTTGGRSIEQHARDAVAGITQSDINEYAASVKRARAERQQRADSVRSAIDNPQTLDDYRTLIKAKGRAVLTAEQGEKYDQLLAEHQIEQQKTQKETPRVTEGFTHDDALQINPVEQGKNSKTGETVYNVNLQTRLGTEKFKEAAGMARKLGGGYWRGNFWFPSPEKAQQFTGWLRGASVDHSIVDVERRIQKQEQQQERLTITSDRLRDSAEDRLNADRKVNTVKRLREAASAMDQANRDLRDADIMQKIAEGIADGGLKYLSGIRHKTQIDTLRGIARRLVYDIPQDVRDTLSYTTADGKREWNDDVPLTSRVKYARYPMLDWHPSTLFDVIGQMGDARGYKLAASELRLSQQREHGMSRLPAGRKANDKLAAYLSGQPGSWPEYVAEYNRLQRAGITTRPLLRAALVELEKLSGDIPLNDIPKIQKMEMDLRKKLAWDRNAFNDFFPTPESRADWIASEADIHPGMDVLEPSAGNGVLAEAARKAGGNVDVVELEQQLRDILKEKGFNVVGSDFDEFTPDKLYDRVLMNPPFSHDLDIKHVQKAFEHMKPGGKLVAIVSTMAGERSNKRNQAFREWLDELGAREEKLPEGMFKESMNPTNVATKLLTLTKPDEINYSKVPRSVWDKDFPDTVLHGRLGDASAHKDYVAAKGGDDAAARRLVADVMTRESVNELRQLLAGRKAILAAVHAEEAVSRNAIPQAMADVLSKALDLDVATGIVQAAKVGRTAQDGFGRLTNQSAFEGPVRTDLPYILLDDTLTQGGTLANLKGYIEDHGGKVIGASALTGKNYSAKIALAADTLRKLRDHFEGTDLENWWNEQHGYGFDRLTESEANYLLRAADADKIRDRVLAARSDGTPSAEPESLRDNGPVPPDVNHKFSQNASESGGVFASGSPRERIRSGVADYQPRGLSKKQVEDEVSRFLKKWKGAGGIAVQVAQDMAEAEQLAGFPLPDALIHAMHLPNSGRIILVAKNLDSLSHVRTKLRHEILGHHALSEVVGPAEYDKLLRAVAAGQNSKSLKPYFDRVAENYESADPWKQVEEVISHVIEDGERGFLGRAWDRVSGAVLQALRKSGFLSDENITAGEVRSMMVPIARRLKKLGGWAENTDKKRDITASFSLIGKDGLFSKPLPGETETEATQRRSKNFGSVVQETIGNVRNLRPTDIIKRLRSNISTNALMIGTLTNRQLAAVYNKLMKTDYAGQYQDLQAKMEARRNRIMNSAERGIENQWSRLDKEESRTLSDLMVDATMTRVHPDKPLAEQDRFQNLKNEQTRLRSSKSGDNKEESASRLARVSADLDAMRDNYNDLHSRWMKLLPEAKELWHDTEKWYKNSYADLKEALIQRINDVGGDQNAALISRVREQFERALKDGPYFPLARFGKYVVTARKDGDYIREHFETRSAALAALEAYRKEGYQSAQSVKAKDNGKNDDSAHSLGKEILDLLNKSEDGNLNKEQLTDQVWQMMLELMPDSSYARHFIRRRRVKGASHDARRAFANSAFHFAHHISKIEYGHKMQAVLDDMGNEIDAAMKGDYSGVQPDNLETAQRMLDELKMRHEMTMNPSGDGFGNALTGTGYVFNMAANPSSAIINMTQTALVALPQLAARYGWKNAMKAMGTATVDYFRSADKRFKWFGKGSSWLDRDAWLSMSRSNRLGADELELMKRLNEDGVISITQASSLAQRAETGTKDKIHFNKALDMSILIGGQLFHNVEVANREVTALAAYRLAKAAAGGRIDPAQAYKVASNAVYDAHFDYSSANRPRWMRQSWQKVVLQFKMYAQHMFYTLGRSFVQSFKGETPEIRRQAQKEFLGYMLMHTLAAGVTGLPYVVQVIFGAAAQGIHAAVSDDDTPWDPEVALKNWLSDELGGFASTAITDGVVNALGIDLHSRAGIQDLLWRSAPAGTEGKDWYIFYMEQMLGPTIGGIGLNFANGYDKMAKGDWLGGIQTVTPAAVKNLVKTYAEATRGVTTSSGEEIVPADEFTHFELAAQAFGFSPSRIGLAYDARSAVKNVQSELSNRRAQLLQRYFANTMRGDDNEGVLDDIQAYNRSNPTNAITGEIILKAMRKKQKARLKKERGLALNRKDEHLRVLGRFGDYEPWG
ncbi:TPA: PLxRFG domain-containing protein [Citrobacter freundii]|nr:PLxRFG domain-containing protein [Citrobacter freundii]